VSEPFVFAPQGDAKRFAPATERNRDAIVAVLRDVLPAAGTVLEVASGTGEHAVHFAGVFRTLRWQPSDPDPAGLASIAAWSAESGLTNILPPLEIDACRGEWPIACVDAILCINMVHIAPWAATEGLFAGAARLLAPNAPLYLYGPYREAGVPTADSNEAFDASLKARDAEWGLRLLDDMIDLGHRTGLRFERRVAMPANSLSLLFRKT
jgi:SAM-dependent methyltransferase